VLGVARFSDPSVRKRLEDWGVETIACDLLDRDSVAKLPRLPNVIHMAGRKFGTAGDPALTWAMNAVVPAAVAETFRDSRIVVFSTLCVYPFAPAPGNGWTERQGPWPPSGEYANSCVGRERVFEFFSRRDRTAGRIVRLNYAIDLRYGVLLEVGRRVFEGQPIDLTMGHANVIWQGDANAHILRCLRQCTTPTSPLNVGGERNVSIREVARAFGVRFGREPVFAGVEADSAWINDCAESHRLFGPPAVTLARMIEWTADWIERRMPVYDKPTKYERRDGVF
jgi:nucleoside-diphosphate-sugar epimerase